MSDEFCHRKYRGLGKKYNYFYGAIKGWIKNMAYGMWKTTVNEYYVEQLTR